MSHTHNDNPSDTPTATLSMVNIDSSDPARAAQFYATALGWNVTYSDDNYGMVEGDGVKLGFGRVDGFEPVQWPDATATKRFHLDLQVDDLETAAARLCAAGASQPDFQPGAERWRVLLDPDGRPFCLCPRPA